MGPARVTMSNVSFLTLNNFIGGQLRHLPRLGKSEAWLLQFMFISQMFAFYSIIEYVICNYLYRVEIRLDDIRDRAREMKKRKISSEEETSNKVVVDLENLDGKNAPSAFCDEISSLVVNKSDMLAVGSICKIDRLLLRNDGTMLIKDERVEIFSRYAYP